MFPPKSFLVLTIILSLSSITEAALFTDDTSTTDKGHIDIEYGANYYKDTQYDYEDDYKTRSRETKFYLYALYGLADNWDIGLTIPYGYINYDRETKHNGFMDIEIESKYRLLEETNRMPSLALYIDFITSSANEDKSLGSGDQDVWLNCIFSKTLKSNLWLDLNLGYYFTGGKNADDVLIYSLATSYGLGEKIYLFAELYGEAEFERNSNDNVSIAALSAGYEINPNLFIKIGVAAGLSDAADDLQISSRINLTF